MVPTGRAVQETAAPHEPPYDWESDRWPMSGIVQVRPLLKHQGHRKEGLMVTRPFPSL